MGGYLASPGSLMELGYGLRSGVFSEPSYAGGATLPAANCISGLGIFVPRRSGPGVRTARFLARPFTSSKHIDNLHKMPCQSPVADYEPS